MITGVDHKENWVKVTECVSPQEWIIRKVVKVTECVSPQEWIIRKLVLKLRNAYDHRSAS